MRRVAGAVGAVCFALGAWSSPAFADEADECASKAEEGQSLRDQSKFIEARENFARCARESCPSVVRKDCNDWVADMDGKIPTVVFAVKDTRGDDVANAKVTVGGQTFALDGKATPMNPGPVHLTFESPGLGVAEMDVVVREGEKARVVEVTIGKEADPRGKGQTGGPAAPVETRTPVAFVVTPWVMAGLSLASFATFGALQGIARGELSDIESGCGATRTCTADVLDPVSTKFTVSGVMFGAGIATLATAVGLWVFAPKVPVDKAPGKASTGFRVDVAADPTRFGAALTWTR